MLLHPFCHVGVTLPLNVSQHALKFINLSAMFYKANWDTLKDKNGDKESNSISEGVRLSDYLWSALRTGMQLNKEYRFEIKVGTLQWKGSYT